MSKLRYWLIALMIWLVFLFNIERLIHPVDITKYTYIFIALVTVVILLVPGVQRISIWILIGLPAFLLLVMQLVTNDPILGVELPITITEVSSLVLTGLLARRVNRYMAEFENMVSKIAISYAGPAVASFEQEQGVMYKELKRARLYERPLGLLTISVTPESLDKELPNILDMYRHSLANQMAIASIAKVLDRELFDTDIIAQYNDTLVVILPELNAENVDEVAAKIQKAVTQNTGLTLSIGRANYPQDAVTFESLLEAANHKPEKTPKGKLPVENAVSNQIQTKFTKQANDLLVN